MKKPWSGNLQDLQLNCCLNQTPKFDIKLPKYRVKFSPFYVNLPRGSLSKPSKLLGMQMPVLT